MLRTPSIEPLRRRGGWSKADRRWAFRLGSASPRQVEQTVGRTSPSKAIQVAHSRSRATVMAYQSVRVYRRTTTTPARHVERSKSLLTRRLVALTADTGCLKTTRLFVCSFLGTHATNIAVLTATFLHE